MSQYSIPCVVYRGGTSRGIFFHQEDLPDDQTQQNHIFLSGIGSSDISQVNGLGGGTSHTSKVAVISRSNQEGVDVNFMFYQLGIGEKVVDTRGTCGNLAAAVGAFAVDEGFIENITEPITLVRVYNKNIDNMLTIKVPVKDGQVQVQGDYNMPGIVSKGAKFKVDFIKPTGGTTGLSFPVGKINKVQIKNMSFEYTFSDIVNPFIFIISESLGLTGQEINSEITKNYNVMSTLSTIRSQVALDTRMATSIEEADLKYPATPKIAFVSEPRDYVTTSGIEIKKEEYDILSRMVSMGRLHMTYAGSGMLNLAATSLLEGTIPNRKVAKGTSFKSGIIRIGHPDGITEIRCVLNEGRKEILSIGYERTVRRIIKGNLFVPKC